MADNDVSTGELVGRLTEQTSRLVRDEIALAKVEMAEKAKHAGIGAGLFSAAGVISLFGFGALVTTAILALALVVPAWLAALIVAVLLFAGAGVAAVVGKNQLGEAGPVAPEETIDSVRRDVQEVKERRHHVDPR